MFKAKGDEVDAGRDQEEEEEEWETKLQECEEWGGLFEAKQQRSLTASCGNAPRPHTLPHDVTASLCAARDYCSMVDVTLYQILVATITSNKHTHHHMI